MTDHRYILKSYDGYELRAAELAVEYPEINRVKRRIGSAAGFHFQEVEGTGRHNHQRLRIVPKDTIDHWGHHHERAFDRTLTCSATAESVRGTVRLLRDQEAEPLARIDADIAECVARLNRLRHEHKDALHQAWLKGNVVRVNALTAVATNGH